MSCSLSLSLSACVMLPRVEVLPNPVSATRRIPFSPRTPQCYTFGCLTHWAHHLQLSATDQSQLGLFFFNLDSGFRTGTRNSAGYRVSMHQQNLLRTNDNIAPPHTHSVVASGGSGSELCGLEAKAIACLSLRNKDHQNWTVVSYPVWSSVLSKCCHAHHQQRQPWLQQPVGQRWQQSRPNLYWDSRDRDHQGTFEMTAKTKYNGYPFTIRLPL